jgi:predicted ATPase/class 3 adenylate cyclase
VTRELLADRYEVVATVSRGGQAAVLRAIDRQHDRVMALKVYRCVGARQRDAMLAEARVLLDVSPHPGLPMLRDDFFVDDRYIIVMDWVEGSDLGQVLVEQGEPGLARSVVLDCVSQVAAALDHLHAHDPPVVHGDVKPANVIRAPTGRITLVDFGIAAAAGPSPRRAGSRGYIAPEVAAGGLLSPAADVYGLAATAVALLTGRPPDGTRPLWEGIDPAEVGPLARSLRRGLATDPARRPRSAGELAERLRAGRFESLPRGVVTFLSSDVVDAAARWDEDPDAMAAAVDRLDDVVAEVIDQHGGRLVRSVGGDAWLSVFAEASAAAVAALALHRRVANERWPRALELRLRAAVHSGEAELRDGEYQGAAVHVAGRLLAVAPAGRTVVSPAAGELMARLPVGAVLFDLASAVPADAPAGGRLFGLVDREADRFVLEAGRDSDLGPSVVWLLCTDVEDSTRLLQSSPERYRTAMDHYRRVLAETCTAFGGTLLSSVEDKAVIALPGPGEAVGAAVAAQQTFASPPPEMASVRVRMGIDVDPAGGPAESALPVSTATALAVCRAGHGGQILMSHAARRLAVTTLAAGVSLLDLGSHRLTDLSQPHRLYQLAHPALRTDFPPLRSLENHPHNLPVQLTRFIGRRRELDELVDLLAANRMCTITGTGGAGKTRLALQVAAEVLVSFPDGVWVADLAGVPNGDEVASTVAAELGVREGGSGTYAAPRRRAKRSGVERLVDHLEYRTALVVLDNCEHIVEHCSRLADVLLRRCERVRILATSRATLGLAGELTYRLGPLELPPPAAKAATVRQCSAVRLFIDRALLRRPDLALGDDEMAMIASICQRVDGIPFAIELAAARVNLFGVAEIAATLGDHLDLLTSGGRSTSARQPTLRAMIAWSDNLLSERERALLWRLSVFAGGFNLDAARHVAGDHVDGSAVLELLAALVDKSLLEAEPATSRFRLLEVTRQYAAERLVEAGEDAAVRAAHLAWYLSLAEQAEVELTGPDQGRWLELIEVDHDNLLAAVASGRDGGNGDDVRLAAAVAQFWLVRGRLSEGRSWLEGALARSPATDALRAKSLWALGLLECFAGDYDRAVQVADEARVLARRRDSRRWEARAEMLLGLVASGHNRPDEAQQHHRAAMDGARATDDQWCYAFALTNLGNVLVLQGATRAARDSYEESLAVRRHEGDVWGMSWVLFRLGVLATWEGRFAEAMVSLEESLERSTAIRFGQGILLAQLGLGEALHADGRHRGAGARFADALATARQLEEDTGAGVALAGLASVAVALDELDAAARWLDEPEADPADDTQRALATRAALLRGRAAVALAGGDDRRAGALHLEALRLRQQLGDSRAIIEELEALAINAAGQGDHRRAAILFGATDRWRSAMGFPVPPRDQPARGAAMSVLTAHHHPSLDAAWQTGRDLSVDDAVSLALAAQDEST